MYTYTTLLENMDDEALPCSDNDPFRPFYVLRREARGLYIPSVVQTIDPPSALEFYRDYVAANRPVVIRNAFQWPALDLWTNNYLNTAVGNEEVTVDITPDGYGDSIKDISGMLHPDIDFAYILGLGTVFVKPEERRMKLSAFLAAMEDHSELNGVPYVSHQNDSMNTEYIPYAKFTDVSDIQHCFKM